MFMKNVVQYMTIKENVFILKTRHLTMSFLLKEIRIDKFVSLIIEVTLFDIPKVLSKTGFNYFDDP